MNSLSNIRPETFSAATVPPPVRAPIDTINAPPFPGTLPWVNVASLRMDKQLGKVVVVEFWDFCRVNSLRTLPYLQAWHERYEGDGLRVIGVHCPGFEPSRDEAAVRDACARLGVEHPVCIDAGFDVWDLYDTPGWPSRYVFTPELKLFEYHHGEGAYAETEGAIQELLGVERELVAPVRPEDDPAARIVAPTPEQPGPYSGPYAAGGVWAVLSGNGTVEANGEPVAVEHPGCHRLIEHERHTEGVLDLRVGDGVTCHAVQFTAGLA
jgi:thiol-disulfide isomerase/thioredoxin